MSLFVTHTYAEDFTNEDLGGGASYTVNGSETYDSLRVEIEPVVKHEQYFLTVGSGNSFTISGTTFFRSNSTEFEEYFHEGTYAFYANGKDGSIQLLGDIDAFVSHDKSIELEDIGANLFYAKDGGSITLGQDGTTSRAWVVAKTPDLISAKNGGKVKIESKRNQFVGSIDMVDTVGYGMKESQVSATFSGADSYWYGDEHSFMNLAVDLGGLPEIPGIVLHDGMLLSEFVSAIRGVEDTEDEENLVGILGEDVYQLVSKYEIKDSIDLTFENGAEWSYLGQKKEGSVGPLTGASIAKRISSITLKGGVINLADEYLQKQWDSIGLSDVLQIDKDFKHDYVRIGDLKGNEGIFRIDLNGDDKSQSDMIFIESSSTGGTHKIEPYKLETLTSIANSNETLVFALTKEGANNIKFEDKENFYGETLFDYEVEIANKTIDEVVLNSYKDEGYVTYDKFNGEDFLNGTAWYIKRVNLKQSAASVGLRSAGYASYDAAVQMDRHDRRLQEAVFNDGQNSGLWVRAQHGQMGAKGVYSSDVDTISIGAEGALSETLRLGASFSYLDGDADFNGIDGSDDLERYEGAVYGTFESNGHYVDVVARLGQVNNSFMTRNAAVSKSGTFHQKYAAVSAEYGYKLATNSGLFIEPQVQAQGAYLGSYEAPVAGGMRMKAEQTTSLTGRVGVRLGKSLKSEALSAEVYARGDVLHQFTDGQDAVLSNDQAESLGVAWGDAGTWFNYGLGGYLKWKNRFGVQLDVEQSTGGEVSNSWLLSGRLNYYF